MAKTKELEVIFWSIALPGFAQLLNGHLYKGTVFIILEFVINIMSNFNMAILHSFQGDIEQAIKVIDFQWLMFYPCLYFFALWDAYRSVCEEEKPFAFLPFVFAAYFVTLGLMFSRSFRIMGILPGPIWLPIISVIPGLSVGFVLKKILQKNTS